MICSFSYAYTFHGSNNICLAFSQTSPYNLYNLSCRRSVVSFGSRNVASLALTMKGHQTLCLSSSNSNENEESKTKQMIMKRRRVRRKDDEGDGKVMDDDKEDEEDFMERLGSNEQLEMVEVKIRSIRDEGTRSGMSSMGKSSDGRGGDNDWDALVGRNEQRININRESTNLESLLADAKRMRAERGGSSNTNSDVSAGDKIINFLSVVVTFDFFVVCGLLLWFLVGVFCSYVLKNDTVQIAFNGIFQPVVQPALGILMIGSAASAILKGKEDEDSNTGTNSKLRG
jgi:hypothetical protein